MDLDPDIPEVFNREYEIDDSLDQSSPSLMELVEQIITHPLILACVEGRARRFVVTRFSGLPDHRQLAMKSTVGKLALILGVVMLHGCGSSGADILTPSALEVENEAAEVSVATFTTLGKPTKIVETPWGPKEIYDPTQDPDVLKIFNRWYGQNQYNYVQYRDIDPDGFKVLEHAGHIHEADYLRLKCEFRERQFVHAETNEFFRMKYVGMCPTRLGNKNLSQCVKENLETRKFARKKNDYRYNPDWGLNPRFHNDVGLIENGFVFGEGSYSDPEEQLQILFKVNCRKWVGISTTYPGFELYQIPTQEGAGDWAIVFGYDEPSMKDFCLDDVGSSNVLCNNYLRKLPEICSREAWQGSELCKGF